LARRQTLSPRLLRPGVLLLVALAAAALAACGSDSTKLSAGEYISKADGICKEEAKKAPRLGLRPSAKDAERLADHRARLRKKLDALDPPTALKPKVAQYDELTKQVIASYRRVATELRRGTSSTIQRLNLEVNQINIRRSKLATQIGYKRCGQPTAGPGATAVAPIGTDPAFIARADAACKQADYAQFALALQGGATLAQAGKALSAVVPAARRAQKQLEALKPPAKDEQTYAAFLVALRRRIDLGVQRAAAAARNDRAAFVRLSVEAVRVADREQRPATQLGFEVCGRLGGLGV
jgi:hypothetical protein